MIIIPESNNDVDGGRVVIPQINRQEIIIESTIGNGSFATVSKVRLLSLQRGYESKGGVLSTTDCSYALKRINHKTKPGNMNKSQEDIIQAILDLKTEANLLSSMPKHDNVVQLYGVSTPSDDNNNYDDCFILLELLQQDTLKDHLDRLRRKESLRNMLTFGNNSVSPPILEYESVIDRISSIGIGIAKGMKHIHSCNVVVRDLKPENIGFCIKTGQPKIFDLGFARNLSTIQNQNEVAGTLRYMAPELARHGIASKASDVHSFGVLLWELCTLQVAFHHFTKQQFVQDVIKGGIRPSINHQTIIPSKSLGMLIKECWRINPNVRPSFLNIVEALESEVATCKQQHTQSSPWSNCSTPTSSSAVQSMLGNWSNSIFSNMNSVHTTSVAS